MRNYSLFSFILLLLLTGCAAMTDDSNVTFTGIGSGIFLIFMTILSTPKLLFFVLSMQGEDENTQELGRDISQVDSGLISKSELTAYKISNFFLISTTIIPLSAWILVLLGAPGTEANLFGSIVGLIISFVVSRFVFFFSDKLNTFSIIARVAMLIGAIICFCIGGPIA